MDTFPISPASSWTVWILAGVCVVLAVVLAALGYTAWSARHSRVDLVPDGVRLVGDFWARTIPYDVLDLANARAVDLTRTPELAPRRRSLGTGLPGYASGWFRLHNGDKALLYLTRRDRVVHLPTRAGYVLLLSVEEPERFLEGLARRLP